MNIYELWLHWKQGDDFSACLNEAGQDVPKALELWAGGFDKCAQHCRTLAKKLGCAVVEVDADTHMIQFSGDKALLDKLVEQELLQKIELEE